MLTYVTTVDGRRVNTVRAEKRYVSITISLLILSLSISCDTVDGGLAGSLSVPLCDPCQHVNTSTTSTVAGATNGRKFGLSACRKGLIDA